MTSHSRKCARQCDSQHAQYQEPENKAAKILPSLILLFSYRENSICLSFATHPTNIHSAQSEGVNSDCLVGLTVVIASESQILLAYSQLQIIRPTNCLPSFSFARLQ